MMSYLDSFMRPNYQSDPGILGLYQFVQQGYDAGKARGQNQAIAQLSQKAYTDTGPAQQQDIAQMIGIDPDSGWKQAQLVQSQQQVQQAAKLAQLQRLGKGASGVLTLLQQGKTAEANGLYQSMLPDIRLASAQHGGPEPSATLDQASLGAITKLASVYSTLPQPAKPISVGPDTTLLDPSTHRVIYQGQGDAGTLVPGLTTSGPNGQPVPVFRDKEGHLKDVFGNIIQQQGQQATSPAAGGVSSTLPAETQAYVPKVLAALAGRPAFDQSGQPTPALLDAVQQTESGGNPNAVSPAGAQGPYQFMPATAASVGVQNPFDPTQARAGAAKYLAQLYQQFGGDANKAIAAYNAGPGRVQQAMGGPQGGLQYTPTGNALAQKIDIARRLGASDADIKNMILGASAGDSGMELLTPDGKALMDAAIAHGYNMPMPSMGYGKAGTAAKAAAINSLAARFKNAGKSPDEAVSQMIEGNTATSGLRSLQHINAKIGGWEQSAAKQADIALGMSNEVGRTGVPIFNAWLLAGRQATGDVKVAQFNNTVNTLAEEYAKVMSGGNASAATDSTRALAHKMLNSAMTADQFAGVVAKMRQEMTARTEGLNAAVMSQRNSITSNEGGNMGGWPDEHGNVQQTTQPAPAAAAPSGWSIEEVH